MATSGKGQELAQAKRRVTEVEQRLARKEQELVQAKRRVIEVEQQLAAMGTKTQHSLGAALLKSNYRWREKSRNWPKLSAAQPKQPADGGKEQNSLRPSAVSLKLNNSWREKNRKWPS